MSAAAAEASDAAAGRSVASAAAAERFNDDDDDDAPAEEAWEEGNAAEEAAGVDEGAAHMREVAPKVRPNAERLESSPGLLTRIAKTTSEKLPRNSAEDSTSAKRGATCSGGLPKAPQPKAPRMRLVTFSSRAAWRTARMRRRTFSLHSFEPASIRFRKSIGFDRPSTGIAAVMIGTRSGGPASKW